MNDKIKAFLMNSCSAETKIDAPTSIDEIIAISNRQVDLGTMEMPPMRHMSQAKLQPARS